MLASSYGFLSGAWPFGAVEAIWSLIALRRYLVAVRESPAARLSWPSLRGRTGRRMLMPMPTDDQLVAAMGGRDYGETLWEPTERAIRDARITDYAAWLAAGSRPRSVRIRRALAVVGGGARQFWSSIWDYFDVLGHRGDGPGAVRRADAGRDLVRRDHAQLCAQRAADGAGRIPAVPRSSTGRSRDGPER